MGDSRATRIRARRFTGMARLARLRRVGLSEHDELSALLKSQTDRSFIYITDITVKIDVHHPVANMPCERGEANEKFDAHKNVLRPSTVREFFVLT
jgi:hypothetical protein